MIRGPFSNEWDTTQLDANRRDYLEANFPFEDIAAQVYAGLHVVRLRTKGYEAPQRGEAKDARQVVFLIRTSHQACDLLYNAPDGLRGRYWQSPDHGFAATERMIRALTPALLSFAEQNPPASRESAAGMKIDDIRHSLSVTSAKLWPRERDDDQISLLAEQKLLVPRWIEAERYAHINKGMWRRTPTSGELEIKGGIVGIDGTEYVPDGKRERSCQIHRFGFT